MVYRRLLLLALLLGRVASAGPPNQSRPATPVEPVGAIVDAFRKHRVVALTDAHGHEQAQAFLVSLVRDPRFAASANDIVVEFGSARYQDVMDRYIRGDAVPYDSVRLAWRNTTIPNEIPVDEGFFRAVRAVNASVPRERQLRVLLGDPPIDWDAVQNREDHFKWIEMRDAYPAALIQIEVLAKQRRALLVYGGAHLQRRNVLTNYDMEDWRAQTIVSLIERATSNRVFTISGTPRSPALRAHADSWHAPSLAFIRDTVFGAADFAEYFGPQSRIAFREGKALPIPREQWRSLPAEDQIDAVLYLGPDSAMTQARLSPALCDEPGYLDMRLRRIALAGLPPVEADRLKELCASGASKK